MNSLGMIEVYGYLTAVEALDTALKAANVKLLNVERVKGGLVTVFITGDVGAVKAAMSASETAARKVGTVVSVHVIARPAKNIRDMLKPEKAIAVSTQNSDNENETDVEKPAETDTIEEISETEESAEKEYVVPTSEEMETMTVDKLRSLARKLRVTNMTKKEIRFATKDDLLRLISEFLKER